MNCAHRTNDQGTDMFVCSECDKDFYLTSDGLCVPEADTVVTCADIDANCTRCIPSY